MLRKCGFHFLVLLLIFLSSGVVFAQNEKKVAYGILLDNTGSLRSQFDMVNTLGKGVVAHVYQKGPVSIFKFTNHGNMKDPLTVSGSEWSQDPAVLEGDIDDLYVLGGQTALLDAIDSIAKELNAKVLSEKDAFASAAIILITDGEDRVNHVKADDLIKELKKTGVKVFAIGLVSELDSSNGFINKSKKGKAVDLLKKITNETGGRALFPGSRKLDLEKLMKDLFAEPAP
ncbi:MAG: VWA domain-containing protein [Pyrinomonadaceae bacterium]